jgi:hypothetical protein
MADEGWKSRKAQMTLIALALMTYAFHLCGHPVELFGEYCMGVLGACGLYKAANVVEKRQNKTTS